MLTTFTFKSNYPFFLLTFFLFPCCPAIYDNHVIVFVYICPWLESHPFEKDVLSEFAPG